MSYRISPAWWPIIGLSSPVLFPMLLVKNGRYKQNITKSLRINKERMERAEPLEMPQLDNFELTVLVEQKVDKDFLGAPGVSYLIKTDLGSLLFDLGYGPENPALAHNAKKLGIQNGPSGCFGDITSPSRSHGWLQGCTGKEGNCATRDGRD